METLAAFYETWAFRGVMITLLIILIVAFVIVRKKQK